MSSFKRKLQKLLFREQWSLLVCDKDGAALKHIAPSSDRMWADPFPVQHDGRYYIFVEQQFNGKNGTLGYIELFADLSHSDFVPILDAPYHLSYPNIFNVGGQWYMIPESNEHNAIELYRATEFPAKWVHDRTLLDDVRAVDTSIFFYRDRWYLFTSIATDSTSLNDSLFIFSAHEFPSSEWTSHQDNPVKKTRKGSRMGGRPFIDAQGRIVRPSQSCVREYGEALILQRVTELSETKFREEEEKTVYPERKHHAVCTHTWNECGPYVIRDIKTRKIRLAK
jgi:hypothetical protein